MAENNTITFYDLTMAHGATTSPFVWATKYALAHKGFTIDTDISRHSITWWC